MILSIWSCGIPEGCARLFPAASRPAGAAACAAGVAPAPPAAPLGAAPSGLLITMSVNVDVVADAEVELDVDVDLAVTATATALEAGSGTGAEDGSDVEAAPLTADANYCKRQRKDGKSVSKPSQNTGTALIHQTFNQMGNQLIIHEASGRCAAKWRQSLSGIDVCTYVWEKSGKKLLVTVAALFPFSDWPKKNIYGRIYTRPSS